MYLINCYSDGELVNVIYCETKEVAQLCSELYSFEFPNLVCAIDFRPMWKECDLDFLRSEIACCKENYGKEV